MWGKNSLNSHVTTQPLQHLQHLQHLQLCDSCNNPATSEHLEGKAANLMVYGVLVVAVLVAGVEETVGNHKDPAIPTPPPLLYTIRLYKTRRAYIVGPTLAVGLGVGRLLVGLGWAAQNHDLLQQPGLRVFWANRLIRHIFVYLTHYLVFCRVELFRMGLRPFRPDGNEQCLNESCCW
jgi:hypothetical protein